MSIPAICCQDFESCAKTTKTGAHLVSWASSSLAPTSHLGADSKSGPVRTIGCCLTAALNSSTVIVATSAVGAIAGGVALVAPTAWRAYHKKQLQDTITSLRDLKKTVAEGLDPARYRHSLRASRFASLERIAEDTKVESGRVIEEI